MKSLPATRKAKILNKREPNYIKAGLDDYSLGGHFKRLQPYFTNFVVSEISMGL